MTRVLLAVSFASIGGLIALGETRRAAIVFVLLLAGFVLVAIGRSVSAWTLEPKGIRIDDPKLQRAGTWKMKACEPPNRNDPHNLQRIWKEQVLSSCAKRKSLSRPESFPNAETIGKSEGLDGARPRAANAANVRLTQAIIDLANGPDRTVEQVVRVIGPGVTMIVNDDLCPRNVHLTRAVIGDPERKP